jgi:hypothetical protein
MKKTMINESELKARIASLNAKMEDAQSMGQTVGKAVGGAAGLATALPRAGIEAGQAIANKAGQWWDQAKQGVSNFAGGVAQGAKQGWAATDPANLVGGGQQQQAAAAKTGMTKPHVAAKPDPAVMARQKELIAAGAKIKADGIMGPATQAAEQQFGGQASVMAANAKDAAAASGTTNAPGTVGTAPGVSPVVAQAASGQGQQPTSESVTFRQEDSLARIIQLSR